MKAYVPFVVGAIALSTTAPAAVPSNGASIQVVPQVSGFRLRDNSLTLQFHELTAQAKKQVKDQVREQIDKVLREQSKQFLNNHLDKLNLDAKLEPVKEALKKVGISLGDLQVAAKLRDSLDSSVNTASDFLSNKTEALVDSLAGAVLAELPDMPTKAQILAKINTVVDTTAIKSKISSYVKKAISDNFLALLTNPGAAVEVLKNKLVEQAKDQVKDQVRKQLKLKSKTADLLNFITKNETMKNILSPFDVNDDDLKKVSAKVAAFVSNGSENIVDILTDKAVKALKKKVNLDNSKVVQKLVDLFKNSAAIEAAVKGEVEEYLQEKVTDYFKGKAAEYLKGKGDCICEAVKKLLPCLKEKSE